jgi:hypothetical protein
LWVAFSSDHAACTVAAHATYPKSGRAAVLGGPFAQAVTANEGAGSGPRLRVCNSKRFSGKRGLCSCNRREAVVAILGLFSASVFVAHAVDAYRAIVSPRRAPGAALTKGPPAMWPAAHRAQN